MINIRAAPFAFRVTIAELAGAQVEQINPKAAHEAISAGAPEVTLWCDVPAAIWGL